MSDIGEMVFLPLLMERVHALAPRLQVEVLEIPLEQLPQALKDGEADLAIGNLAGLGRHTRHADLFSERYACMGRRGHPVLSAGLTRGHRPAPPALPDAAALFRRRRDRAPYRPDRYAALSGGYLVQPRQRVRDPPPAAHPAAAMRDGALARTL
ncbi:hypothetical protein G6F22_019401 [Rhizopus arrhizus]|nr:hypothetical protein G6F22_019401 [Rhizopus arrhizus]